MDNNLDTSEVSLIIGATASAIAVIVYSLKHVQKSSCCGGFFKCNQVVIDDPCIEFEPELEPEQTIVITSDL